MYCPNCATETSIDQKFCRTCGMSLALVSQAMSGQALAPTDASLRQESAGEPDMMEERRSKLMRRGFALLFAALAFIIVMGIGGDEVARVNHTLGHLMNTMAGLGTAALLAGVGMIVYGALLPTLTLRHQSRGRAISSPTAAADYQGRRVDTASMEPERLPAPSVTEHTTYTLEQREPDPISRQN